MIDPFAEGKKSASRANREFTQNMGIRHTLSESGGRFTGGKNLAR
jgi:hypothetical protein